MGERVNLQHRVRIERRVADVADGAGNVQDGWVRVGPTTMRAEVTEVRAGTETVEAAKLQGVALCNVVMRASAVTRSISPDDRLIMLAWGNERVLNVRHAPKIVRDDYVRLLCEDGVAT